MEASPLPACGPENWVEHFDQTIAAQRERIREFLAAQQQRLVRAEAELGKQLQQIANELAENRRQTRQVGEDLQQRSERLSRESETLEALKQEFSSQQAQWERLQQHAAQQQQALVAQIQQQQQDMDRRRAEWVQRQGEIDAAEARLHHDQQQLAINRADCQAELERLAALRETLEARQTQLDEQQQQLATRQAETETQRRQIARELKAQYATQTKERQRRLAEADAQRAELDARSKQLEDRRAELDAEGAEIEHRRAELKAQRTEVAQCRADVEQQDVRERAELERRLNVAQKYQQELSAELESTRAKCERLEKDLSQAKAIVVAPSGSAEERAAAEDLRRLYDMAMDDVRSLKAQNADLQRRLAQTPATATVSGPLNWEAEKRRIMAALESDFPEDDREAAGERLKIETVLERTDGIIAAKDREIADLRQLLHEQSATVGATAVGAAALGELLDSDAVIREERESLKKLQEEWREKLRVAEVELSLERARIARERATLEENRREIEERAGKAAPPPGQSGEAAKPARGRWLSRLGLKEEAEEKKK